LVLAGLDTSGFAVRAALWHLAAYPDHREQLLEEPSLLNPFIEEVLRMYSPATAAMRTAQAPTEFDGCPIPEESRIVMLLPAANRGPAQFEAPNEFRPDRPRNQHLTFGVGRHRCIGAHIARLEVRVTVSEWLARFPEFELITPETT